MKIQLLLALLLASTVCAEEIVVQKNGNTVTVQQPGRTTVVKGADARTAGQLVGETAKAASNLGLGIADAFGAKTGQNTKVQVQRQGNIRQETTTVIVDEAESQGNRIVESSRIGQEARNLGGKNIPGVFTVSIAGDDGSASTYQEATNVRIFKDGKVYNEQAGSIHFTGSVEFTTANGEEKFGRGVIGLIEE